MAGAAGLLLSACIPSVNPFYTDKDVIFATSLLGEWQVKDKEDEPQHWRFERGNGTDYALTVRDDEGKEGEFKATLFKLKDHQFLDLLPTECEYATNQADLVAFSMFRGHLLVHVAQMEPELRMAFFDFEWLADHLKENPKALPHGGEDGLVLTASTRQLQRFVLRHLEEGALFSDYGELTRNSGGNQ